MPEAEAVQNVILMVIGPAAIMFVVDLLRDVPRIGTWISKGGRPAFLAQALGAFMAILVYLLHPWLYGGAKPSATLAVYIVIGWGLGAGAAAQHGAQKATLERRQEEASRLSNSVSSKPVSND